VAAHDGGGACTCLGPRKGGGAYSGRVLLAIYLNDHLAASTGALELVRRSARSNRGTPYGDFLAELAQEVEEDRASLLEIMRALGVRRDELKVAAGWVAEKAGRLKLNGRLLGYSPYSRVVELEVLLLGVRGKLALWQALQQIEADEPRLDGRALKKLVARADSQLERIESNRRRAAVDAFVAPA
jgi:hypothetical protein